MEELSTIFGNVGILVAALAGGISLVMFGFAGIQYMTAQGDPQGMSRAKMSVIGAVVGLAIAGLAFVMPGHHIQAHHRARRRRKDRGGRHHRLRPTSPEPARIPERSLHRRKDERSHPPDSSPAGRLRKRTLEPECSGRQTASAPPVASRRTHLRQPAVGQDWRPDGPQDALRRVHRGDRHDEVNLRKGLVTTTSSCTGTMASPPADNSKCWMYVSRLNTWDQNY